MKNILIAVLVVASVGAAYAESEKVSSTVDIAINNEVSHIRDSALPSFGHKFKSEEKRSLVYMQTFLKGERLNKEYVWPGYNIKNIAMVMQGHKNDFFFNAINCSESSYLSQAACSYQTVDVDGLKVYVKPDKFFEAPVGCIRPIIADKTFKTWIAYLPSYDRLSGLYKTVGQDLSYDDYLLNWVHESFHVFQISNWEPMTKLFVDQKEYLKGVDNKKIYKLMAKEGKVLYKAMMSKDRNKVFSQLKSFFNFRDKRRKLMRDDVVELEKMFELSEGTAQYVQYKSGLSLMNNPPDIKDEPLYTSFKYAADRYHEKLLLVKDLDYAKTPMRGNWCYNWGMAQAIILDKISPDWKQEMNKKAFFLEDKLRSIVDIVK